jgi:predicted Zn-dependent peptidase
MDPEFYAVDLMTDILSRGKSSRLYNNLVKDKKLFSELNCYTTSEFDKSLVIVEGRLVKGTAMNVAETAIDDELKKIMTEPVSDDELNKVKNKVESTIEFSEIDLPGRALNLAIAEYMGDADLINMELKKYEAVTKQDIMNQASQIFRNENCSVLYYLAKA